MRLRLIFVCLFALSLCFYVEEARAVSPSSILVAVSPENPGPGENVSISLRSYAANLDSVNIQWLVNGKSFLSGTGRKSISLNAPRAGEETTVIVRIDFPDGEVEIRIPIRPNSLILLWQATDSFVPPFYKGKALPTGESEVKVVALPEITRSGSIIDPQTLVYDWKVNYENEQSGSGYGLNYFIYETDFLEYAGVVGVTATTTDQKNSAEGSINIPSYEPKIVFYKRDAKLGTLFERALPARHVIIESEVIEALPYYISPKSPTNPILSWNWSINGVSVPVPSTSRNLLPVKAGEGLSGVAKLRLDIENRYKIFQTANKEIEVEF